MTETADLFVYNARIYTGDPGMPWAENMEIRNGKIVAIGPTAIAGSPGLAWINTLDFGGAFVMPGLVDVHNHHALAGKSDLFELKFSADADLETILAAVREWSEPLAPDAWVVGGSWGSTLIGTLSRESSRLALDEASGGRPVMLGDDSHHNRWANTRALELAGIALEPSLEAKPRDGARAVATAAPVETAGIVRDPVTGVPTGVLLEAAGIPVEQAMSRTRTLTEAQHLASSARGIAILHSFGVTAFQDAGASTDILRSLKTLDDQGKLTAWVVSSLLVNDEIFGFSPIGEELLAAAEAFRTEHHRPDFVKIFLDGVPPTRTGAFLEPYLPDGVHGAHHTGDLIFSPDELVGWLRNTAERGFSAKIHCTGDASVRAVLDAVEIVRSEGYSAAKYQIAHGQFVHSDDVARFMVLGVTADISPFIWVPGVIPQAIAEVLPPEIAAHIQPNRDLLDAGALIAGGSDWPVSESPNAFEGIHGLVTRADPFGVHPGTLWPEQAVTLEEALAIFTINAARAMGVDGVTGSLEVGKSADFVVLDRDPFSIDPAELVQTTVRQTWFAGRPVYRAAG